MFKTNEAGWDRGLRAAIGVGLALTLLTTNVLTGTLATVAWVVAAIMLVTAATGFCGLYALLGIDTCKVR